MKQILNEMKIRPFNLFDALFILGVYFKVNNSIEGLNWFEVFAVYLLEALLGVVAYLQWPEKIRFWIFKTLMKRKIDAGATRLKKQMNAAAKAGNPGQHINPADFPNRVK